MKQNAPMLVAYLESLKYVGHFFPVALLRIYLGWSFFTTAWQRYHSDYLSQPRIAAAITEWAPTSAAPEWYKELLDKNLTLDRVESTIQRIGLGQGLARTFIV